MRNQVSSVNSFQHLINQRHNKDAQQEPANGNAFKEELSPAKP